MCSRKLLKDCGICWLEREFQGIWLSKTIPVLRDVWENIDTNPHTRYFWEFTLFFSQLWHDQSQNYHCIAHHPPSSPHLWLSNLHLPSPSATCTSISVLSWWRDFNAPSWCGHQGPPSNTSRHIIITVRGLSCPVSCLERLVPLDKTKIICFCWNTFVDRIFPG